MIREVSAMQSGKHVVKKTDNRQFFCANSREEKGDRFEKVIHNPNKNVAKTSIIAGIISAIATLGLMVFTKRGKDLVLFPHEYVTIPGCIGGAVALLTNFIGNKFSKN